MVPNSGSFMVEEGWSYIEKRRARGAGATSAGYLTAEVARAVRSFHQGIKGYQTTPLVVLRQLAKELKVGGIYVKDLSSVLSLDSFKVLGASYAVFKLLCNTLNLDEKTASFEDLKNITKGKFTFVTATDGNFGKAIAWAAQQLGQKALVYVPRNTIIRRRKAIEMLGARVLEAESEDKSLDAALHEAASYLGKDSYLVISDASWESYEEIPKNVMQGYLTICDEVTEQLGSFKVKRPSHVFLQVGCGGFAASIVGYYNSVFGNDRPTSVLVEPAASACFLQSIRNNRLTKTKIGDTVMAGLCAGEPSTLAWHVLYNYGEHYISIPDDVASYGVRILAEPKPSEKAIISGESGAAGIGCLVHMLKSYPGLVNKIGIDENSTILLFNTEGATGEIKTVT